MALRIQRICKEPDVMVAGIIIEAYGTKVDKNIDKELAESLLKGEITVSEIDNKHDIILMVFSTPIDEELISYFVDPETKTIGESFSDGAMKELAGTFSHFFNWNKN